MAAITVDDLSQAVSAFTRRPAEVLLETATIASLNLDSLALLEIIGQVEERFSLEVDEDALVDIVTVGDLLRVLNNARAHET